MTAVKTHRPAIIYMTYTTRTVQASCTRVGWSILSRLSRDRWASAKELGRETGCDSKQVGIMLGSYIRSRPALVEIQRQTSAHPSLYRLTPIGKKIVAEWRARVEQEIILDARKSAGMEK
jgi:hypothetical protein